MSPKKQQKLNNDNGILVHTCIYTKKHQEVCNSTYKDQRYISNNNNKNSKL